MPTSLTSALILALAGFLAGTLLLAASPVDSRRAAVGEAIGCICAVLIAVVLVLMLLHDLFLPA